MILQILISMRPKQWIKNFFVLAALVFSKNLLDTDSLYKSLEAFGLFCLISSSVYIINDILDLEKDKRHPEKRKRPLAAGKMSVPTAWAAAVTMLSLSLLLSFWLKTSFGAVSSAYLVLNLAYSIYLKHVVIIDVMMVAFGFLLRAVAGAVVINVDISSWFMLCTVLLALFLGFVKRRHELAILEEGASDHRKSLEEYSSLFLDQMIAVVTSATLICYALYTMSPEVVRKLGTERLDLTVPFVLYGILRYLYLAYEKGEGGNPTTTILNDGPLLIDLGLWLLTLVLILYT